MTSSAISAISSSPSVAMAIVLPLRLLISCIFEMTLSYIMSLVDETDRGETLVDHSDEAYLHLHSDSFRMDIGALF